MHTVGSLISVYSSINDCIISARSAINRMPLVVIFEIERYLSWPIGSWKGQLRRKFGTLGQNYAIDLSDQFAHPSFLNEQDR